MSDSRWAAVRRYRRVTMRVPVRVRCLADGSTLSVEATTLGAGGLFVPTPNPLPPGTQLTVRFNLPGDDGDHSLHAEVVWANAATTPGVSAAGRGMGVAFRDAGAIARLAKALGQIESSETSAE
jgi:uncharacterized protein (TIGR02266 family)